MILRYLSAAERTQDGITAILQEQFGDASFTVSSSSTVFTFCNGLTATLTTSSLSSVYAIALGAHGAILFYGSGSISNFVGLWVSDLDEEATSTKITAWPAARSTSTVAYKAQTRVILAPVIYGYNGYLCDLYDVTKPGTIGNIIEVDDAKYMYVTAYQVIGLSEIVEPEEETE